MKIRFMGDLHGKLPETGKDDFDILLATGDFCPSDETRPFMFRSIEMKLEDPESKTKWFDIAGRGKTEEMTERSVTRGREILEYLDSLSKPVFVVPGNGDWFGGRSSWPFLRKNRYREMLRGLNNIIDVHEKAADIGGIRIIGYGVSSGPEIPQYDEDVRGIGQKKMSEMGRAFGKKVDMISSLFDSKTPAVFLTHNVPFGTSLDKIRMKESPRFGKHFGSLIVREIIERKRPLACIGGHMHENRGKCVLGETLCVNAGFGSRSGGILEISGGKLKDFEIY